MSIITNYGPPDPATDEDVLGGLHTRVGEVVDWVEDDLPECWGKAGTGDSGASVALDGDPINDGLLRPLSVWAVPTPFRTPMLHVGQPGSCGEARQCRPLVKHDIGGASKKARQWQASEEACRWWALEVRKRALCCNNTLNLAGFSWQVGVGQAAVLTTAPLIPLETPEVVFNSYSRKVISVVIVFSAQWRGRRTG